MVTVLTEAQPATPAHDQLQALACDVLRHLHQRRRRVPMAIRRMWPCVRDAVSSGDEAYCGVQYEHFASVVAESLDGWPRWLADELTKLSRQLREESSE